MRYPLADADYGGEYRLILPLILRVGTVRLEKNSAGTPKIALYRAIQID